VQLALKLADLFFGFGQRLLYLLQLGSEFRRLDSALRIQIVQPFQLVFQRSDGALPAVNSGVPLTDRLRTLLHSLI